MIRFTVLNEEEQAKSKEEESEEIQAEKCLGVYQSAIRLSQKGKLDEARKMLKTLIESDLLQKIDNDTDMAARGTPLRLLQYLVYTNYASILEQSPDQAQESVLQYYLKAVSFDSSDNSLWIKIGRLAAKEKKHKLARYALECGLQQSSPEEGDTTASTEHIVSGLSTEYDLTPSQWMCLETLCEVLYEIGDLVACQEYVQKALRLSPYFQRGIELQELVCRRLEEVQDHSQEEPMQTDEPHILSSQTNDQPKELVLEDLSWAALGELLLDEYRSVSKNSDHAFYNRRLVVISKETEETTGDEDVAMKAESVAPAEMTDAAEMTEAEPEEVLSDEAAATTENGNVESPAAGTMDVVMEALPTDEVASLADKELLEIDQGIALKRKRKEVEERSGLRTSKRVRDKLDQFEVTKKQREEEEQVILAKYRVALSRFGMDLESGYYGGPSSDPLKADEIFPDGISRFMQVFNKHLERPNAIVQASTMEHVQQQKTNHFAIFTLDKSTPPTATLFESNTSLQNFIKMANEQNSGIIEYLCLYISMLLSGSPTEESTSNWQQRWPGDVRPTVSEIMALIEDCFLEFIHCESEDDTATYEEIQLSRLERWLVRAGQALSNVSDGSKGIPTDRRAQSASLRFNWMRGRAAQCGGDAEEAIARFETCLKILQVDASIRLELPNCKYDTAVSVETVQDRLSKLKTHQYVLDAERLFSEGDYQAVLTRLGPIFLSKDASEPIAPLAENIADPPRMDADDFNTIGGSLSERIELMSLLYKSCEALKDRKKQFDCITEMLVRVVTALVNTTTERSEATETWYLFSQTSHMLMLMRETIQASDLNELLKFLDPSQLQKLICCVLAVARLGFVNILHQDRLVDDDVKVKYSTLLKNRPHLEQFNLVVFRTWMLLLLLLPGWIPNNSTVEAQNKGDTTTETFAQFATVPLDMADSDLDAETLRTVVSSSLTTNSGTTMASYPSPSQELYMEIIALVHDDLGVREICALDNSKLYSSPRFQTNPDYLFTLQVDNHYPIEHSSIPVDFDKKAAIEFFPLLERYLSDRGLKGQIRGDLKDAVDRVEEALGSPPYERNSILCMNRHIVDDYLSSEINFAEAIRVNSLSKLPTMDLPPSSRLPSVYRSIYAIQGKNFFSQFRNKAKNNQFKPLEDLQMAIDQFRTDLHVNPGCWDSWYSLALCYASLADENLVFSASDIKNNFSKIKDLQRRAFLCFAQASRLAPKRRNRDNADARTETAFLNGEHDVEASWVSASQESEQSSERPVPEDCEPKLPDDTEVKKAISGGEVDPDKKKTIDEDQEWRHTQATFWFDFGNLTHGIMSQPMRMEAMRRTARVEAVSDTGEVTTIYIPEPSSEQVYTFAAFCFKRSLVLNDQNWRAPYMLGKCVEKLDGKPNQVLSLYRMATDLVPRRSGQPGNEKIFEAVYKLISTLTKYLDADKIKPSVVEQQMMKSLAKLKLNTTEGESFIFEPPTEHVQAIESAEIDDHNKKGKMQAYRLLCEGLARIRYTDKRHWHHRPVYRQSWILYNIYHDVERAKTEMLGLFQIKSNLKTLVSSVWKPEFERSGKHFIYVGEYTKFLIILAKETKDVETLNSLARKIRRANGLLLDLKEIWELLYDSYLWVLGDLVGPEPALAVAEVIPRMEFREKAAIYEAKMFEQDPKPVGLTVLQRLCELKKLNDKMAPEGQMGHFLAVCYSKLFIEVGGAELYPKELVRQLQNPTEGSSGATVTGSAMDVDQDPADTSTGSSLQSAEKISGTEGKGGNDDQKEILAKMAKLSTEVAKANGSSSLDPTAGGGIEEASVGDKVKEMDALSSASGTNTPSNVSLDSAAKDTEMAPAGDGLADLEDWRSRKKISATELASRATTLCKAPPPSLKAPPTLQSKMAGPPPEEPPSTGPSNEPPSEVSTATGESAVDKALESSSLSSTQEAPSEVTATEQGNGRSGEEEVNTTAKDPVETEIAKQLGPVKRTSSRRNSRVEESL
ncbi:Histone transcription regulator 3 [Gryganskiella cystojenkinii]|nr:Histone transcription regulator 3 [Gryganskiella cystojenkinii]